MNLVPKFIREAKRRNKRRQEIVEEHRVLQLDVQGGRGNIVGWLNTQPTVDQAGDIHKQMIVGSLKMAVLHMEFFRQCRPITYIDLFLSRKLDRQVAILEQQAEKARGDIIFIGQIVKSMKAEE